MSSLRRRAIVVTAREVGGAQVDRRPGQRADDRGGVERVGEHPQPRERVADLRALEERGVAGHPERHAALLERRGDQPPLAPARADDHADPLGQRLARREQLLDLARGGLRLGALALAAPEAHRPGAGLVPIGRRLVRGAPHSAPAISGPKRMLADRARSSSASG